MPCSFHQCGLEKRDVYVSPCACGRKSPKAIVSPRWVSQHDGHDGKLGSGWVWYVFFDITGSWLFDIILRKFLAITIDHHETKEFWIFQVKNQGFVVFLLVKNQGFQQQSFPRCVELLEASALKVASASVGIHCLKTSFM